jgi:hypothetical protein
MSAPFTPSHRRRFRATKLFTDREKPVTLFLRAFDLPPRLDDRVTRVPPVRRPATRSGFA